VSSGREDWGKGRFFGMLCFFAYAGIFSIYRPTFLLSFTVPITLSSNLVYIILHFVPTVSIVPIWLVSSQFSRVAVLLIFKLAIFSVGHFGRCLFSMLACVEDARSVPLSSVPAFLIPFHLSESLLGSLYDYLHEV